MADVEKLTVTLAANIGSYNADLERAAKYTQQQTAKMDRDFASLGKFGQRSPQSLDKIATGMSSLGKTALASQVETELLNASLKGTGEAAVEVSHAIGAMSTQGMAAFHALRGGGEMLAQGVDPMRVLAMEMNNLTYAASGAGGLKGAMMEALAVFKGMLNPVVALTAGIVGAGLAVVGLGASFARSQSKIDMALTGVGKSAGATVGQINQIAESVSKAGDLSTSEASDIATAIASTGRASAESTRQATELAHAYSLVFNKDLNKSAADLALAIADPAQAIDGLNERLGAWSAKQVELVKNLTMSGDREKAAKIIIDGMQKSIGDATAKTDFWTRSWNGLANAISNAMTASGKAIDQAAGITTPEDALNAAEARLKQLQEGRTGPRGGTTFGTPQEIQRQIDLVTRLRAQVEALQKTTSDNRAAVDVSNLVKNIDPTLQKLDELGATIAKIESVPIDNLDQASQAVVKNVLSSLKSQHDLLAKDIALSQDKYGVTLAQASAEERAAKIEIAAINARTPAQKADIAYLQTRNALLDQGKSPQEAKIGAQIARTKTLTEAQHALSEAQRDRVFQAGQTVAQAQLENSVVGQSIDVVTTLTQRFQLLAAARAEANKNGTTVSPEELAAMDEAAKKLGQLATATAALNVQKQAQFDIAQLGRGQSEQSVYGTLQSAGLLTNGEIVSAQAKQTAEVLRTKEALIELADTEKTFASSFLHDLMQGKSAAEALGNALNSVASKLLDMGLDKLISGASGANGGILSLLGFASGGYVSGPGSSTSDSIPAQLSNGEYVINAAATKKHRALLEAINTGTVGKFAAGGPVRMPNVSIPTPVHASPAQSITIAPQIVLQNGTKEGVLAAKNDFGPELDKRMRAIVLETLDRKAAARRILR